MATIPFVASFTAIQEKGGAVVITDTSNFSSEAKGTFTSRSILIYKADGALTTIPFQFSDYPLDIISLKFDRDYCLRVMLKFTKTAPQSISSYTAYMLKSFNQHTVDFMVNISQSASLSSKFNIGRDFYKSMCDLFMNNEGAISSANALKQIEAQSCLNRNYFVMNQQIVL